MAATVPGTNQFNAANATPAYHSDSPGAVKGYEQLGTLSSAGTLTVPADATTAMIVSEGGGARWRADGTAPTASVGMPLATGGTLWLGGAPLAAAQFIQSSGTLVLNATYYG